MKIIDTTDAKFDPESASGHRRSFRRGKIAPTTTVSANGAANGIVWAVFTSKFQSGGAAVLRAYDAANVSRQLFESSKSSANQAGPAVKFVVPTIADGHVYIGTQSELDVYGILP